jgi:hypothetical protein
MMQPSANLFNWVTSNIHTALNAEAREKLAKVKRDRSQKTYKLVKVSDKPPTWKEVEVK